jgi:thiosulfate reductase cytochrome b subunit
MKLRIRVIWLFLLCAGAISAAVAEEAVTDTLHSARDCLKCHAIDSDQSHYKIDYGKLHNPSESIDFRLDVSRYGASNHGKLACRVCHVIGKEIYPHLPAARGQYIGCVYCHQRAMGEEKFNVSDITGEFEHSYHYQKHSQLFDCTCCHDPHVFDITDSTKTVTAIIADDNEMCRQCHMSREQFAAISDREFPVLYEKHSWLPFVEKHLAGVRCVECHTAHTESISHETFGIKKAEKDCLVCHQSESILMTTLYKAGASRDLSAFGFTNKGLFEDKYVFGAIRNPMLERIGWIVLAATLAGVLGHGFFRLIFSRKRTLRLIESLYLYPGWVRVWHLLNGLTFITLIITGFSLHFAEPDRPLIPIALAVKTHNIAGIGLCLLWAAFLLGNLISGNHRHYVPVWRGVLQRMITQVRFYLFRIMRGESHPYPATEKSKFNPLQQMAYNAIMFGLVPVVLLTGVVMLLPEYFPQLGLESDQVWPVALAHTIAGFFAVVFMVVHIYLGTTGDKVTALFKGMLTGWHDEFAQGDGAGSGKSATRKSRTSKSEEMS